MRKIKLHKHFVFNFKSNYFNRHLRFKMADLKKLCTWFKHLYKNNSGHVSNLKFFSPQHCLEIRYCDNLAGPPCY